MGNNNGAAAAANEGKAEQNIMGYMPCGQLVLKLSVPMMMSMLVQALYNIVDSVFVSRVSEAALTAVSLAFPLQSFLVAVAVGTGVGVNARLSRKLGEKNINDVNITAGNALTIAAIYSIVFFILGLTICRPFYTLMTDDPEIIQYGVDYTSVVLTLAVCPIFQIALERTLQATGKSFYSMITQTTGAIINVIMDPIMIFGLFGFPAMGTKGAAIATVLGQAVAAVLALIFNLRLNKEITFSLKYLKPHAETIKTIYIVGIPSIIMQSISSIMNFGMNKILLQFSSTAATAFGVYFKLQSFVFMPVFGLNNGIVPIVAYNYGARNPDRIKKTFNIAIAYAVAIMLAGAIIFEAIPGQLLSIFNASENLYDIGIRALRIIAIHFVLAGYGIVCSSMMQALGHGVRSLIVSLIRQIVVLLPVAYIFANIAGLSLVWFSFPIAEMVSVVVSTLFTRDIFKKEIEPLYK